MLGLVYLSVSIGKLVFMITVFYAFQSDTEVIAILNVNNIYLRGSLSVTIVLDELVSIPSWSYSNLVEMESFMVSNVKPSMSKYLRRSVSGRSLLTFVASSLLLVPSVCMAVLVPDFWNYAVLISCVIYTPLTLILPNIQWLILAKRKPIWKVLIAIMIMLF